MPGPLWPDQRTEDLRRMIFDECLTDLDAANRLGVSKASVTQKRQREGWPGGTLLRKHTSGPPRNEAMEALHRDPLDALPVPREGLQGRAAQ